MARLTAVHLSGPGKEDAVVRFSAGPNVIAGDSNTGKSYILRCVDYLFGADEMSKRIDEADGYDVVRIELARGDNDHITLERALNGSRINYWPVALDQVLVGKAGQYDDHNDDTGSARSLADTSLGQLHIFRSLPVMTQAPEVD